MLTIQRQAASLLPEAIVLGAMLRMLKVKNSLLSCKHTTDPGTQGNKQIITDSNTKYERPMCVLDYRLFAAFLTKIQHRYECCSHCSNFLHFCVMCVQKIRLHTLESYVTSGFSCSPSSSRTLIASAVFSPALPSPP